MPERRLYIGTQITTTAVNLEVKIAFILLFVNLCLQGPICSRFHTNICFPVGLLYLHKREVFDSTCVTIRHGEVWHGERRFVASRYEGPTHASFSPKFAHATTRFAISEYPRRALNDPVAVVAERVTRYIATLRSAGAVLRFPFARTGRLCDSFNEFLPNVFETFR